MSRFDIVFEKLERPVLMDSDTARVTVIHADDGASAIEGIKVTPESVDKLQTSPIAQRQRRYETALGAALAPFDGGDEPLPPTASAHVGRKPWGAS